MAKKILTLVFIGIMITSIVALAEEVIDQNQQAEELKELGLFKGSDEGFELERPPRRVESENTRGQTLRALLANTRGQTLRAL